MTSEVGCNLRLDCHVILQDLLTTVNIPEWPAAELLLSLLGRVLREKFKDKSTEMALRISSLEYLGTVSARLRKDAVQSKLKLEYIDSIVQSIKEEEEKEGGDSEAAAAMERLLAEADDPEDERNLFLHRVLLDYLTVNGGEDDQAAMNARHFYICQWYRSASELGKMPKRRKQKKQQQQSNKRGRGGGGGSSDEESAGESEDEDDDDGEAHLSDSKKAELYRLREARKVRRLSAIRSHIASLFGQESFIP